ncbi:RNB-domain-containing protein [Tilletiaria anomala UBC 951]|uniref:RNB-domain-containing protein n=1 Tax=Tilletiaria anomala (strain ATCC 24038 / CBS 436.72 / UBC 951) TaxID=1037660 RepID=A0A066WFL3_TILAU|nr:RNB-domain-containing protein [Tilletiaria anomala UBC 951]KDN52767.1 RNB-domain-containing protein [Tilletiaria anomala UBC 951]
MQRQREREAAKAYWSKTLKAINTDVEIDLRSVQSMTKGTGLKPGDFVEIRRAFKHAHAIILDVPAERDAKKQTSETGADAFRTIYALLSSGIVDVFRETDIVVHYPALADSNLAKKATPAFRHHVGDPKVPAAPPPGSEEPENYGDNVISGIDTTGASVSSAPVRTLEEPVDEERFQARAKLCTTMRILMMKTQEELQRLTPAFTEHFIDAVAEASEEDEKKEEATPTITTLEATQTLLRRAQKGDNDAITRSQYLATHLLLMSHPDRFVASSSAHRQAQLFKLRPQSETRLINNVKAWLQAPEGTFGYTVVTQFVRSTSRLLSWKAEMLRSVLHHESSDANGPPRKLFLPSEVAHTWSPEEQDIIQFLKLSLGSRRLLQEDVYASGAMEILKLANAQTSLTPATFVASGLAPSHAGGLHSMPGLSPFIEIAGDDLHHGLVVRFLQDIGILAPWQNPIALDADLRSLVGDDPGEVNNDEPSREHKPHESLRGPQTDDERGRVEINLPAYVIDDEGAHELDDGVSIEPVSGTTDQVWVHVHVADPTAFLQPNSELAKLAAKRQSSIYFPEVRWPLLPSSFVNSGIGLGTVTTRGRRDDDNTEGQRAMTFSAKVGLDGTVHDYRVQLTWLNRVKVMTYKAVDEILSSENRSIKLADTKDDLDLLRRVARALSKRRISNNAISTGVLAIQGVRVSHSELLQASTSLQTSHLYTGFPQIQLAWDSGEQTTSAQADYFPAREIVAEMMVLAGRVAGQYGAEHGIPLPYRAQSMPEDPTAMRRLRSLPRMPDGSISYDAFSASGITLPAAHSIDEPAMHFSMGICGPEHDGGAGVERDALSKGGYVRATSPLRRYPDMVAHWQIRHSLLSGTTSQLPWNREALQRQLPSFDRMAALTNNLSRTATGFWIFKRIEQIITRGYVDESPGVSEDDKALQQLVLGEMDAVVVISDVRINPATLKAMVRIRLEGLNVRAECEWPFRQPPAGSTDSLNAGVTMLRTAPFSGDRVRVKIVGVLEAGLRVGLLCRLVE